MSIITCLFIVAGVIILCDFTSLRILTKVLNLFLAIQNDKMENVIANATDIYSFGRKCKKVNKKKKCGEVRQVVISLGTKI